MMADWVECPEFLMVKYEIGIKPTPQAMESRRMPMYGTFLGYSLFFFV